MSTNYGTEHDQATVSSPTDQYHSEKYSQQQGSTTTGRKSTSGGIFGKIGRFPLLTWGLRALQMLSSIVALALASRSLHKFFNSERRMRFTSFVGSLSILYLIVLGLLSFFKPAWVMAGPVWIMETLLAILWLCAFIAIASRYSGFSCRRQSSSSYGSGSSGYGSSGSSGYGSGSGSSGSGYNYITYPQYGGSSHVTGCRSSKAAIAFAGFSFLLFAIGSALLFFNVIRRLMVHKRQNSLFQTGSQSGVRLNKPALAFSRHYDPDAEFSGEGGNPKYSGSHDVESGGYGDNQTYTNEQTGGYNASGTYNNTQDVGYSGNTGNTGTTGGGYNRQQTMSGNARNDGSNLQYPEGSHQRTY